MLTSLKGWRFGGRYQLRERGIKAQINGELLLNSFMEMYPKYSGHFTAWTSVSSKLNTCCNCWLFHLQKKRTQKYSVSFHRRHRKAVNSHIGEAKAWIFPRFAWKYVYIYTVPTVLTELMLLTWGEPEDWCYTFAPSLLSEETKIPFTPSANIHPKNLRGNMSKMILWNLGSFHIQEKNIQTDLVISRILPMEIYIWSIKNAHS